MKPIDDLDHFSIRVEEVATLQRMECVAVPMIRLTCKELLNFIDDVRALKIELELWKDAAAYACGNSNRRFGPRSPQEVHIFADERTRMEKSVFNNVKSQLKKAEVKLQAYAEQEVSEDAVQNHRLWKSRAEGLATNLHDTREQLARAQARIKELEQELDGIESDRSEWEDRARAAESYVQCFAEVRAEDIVRTQFEARAPEDVDHRDRLEDALIHLARILNRRDRS